MTTKHYCPECRHHFWAKPAKRVRCKYCKAIIDTEKQAAVREHLLHSIRSTEPRRQDDVY